MLKTLIGAFLGALFAFGVNLWLQFLQRKRDRKAAGNLAIAILSQQFGDFAMVKAGIDDTRKSVREQHPVPSEWTQLQPTLFSFSDALKLELGPLSFLMEKGDSDIVEKLILADRKYHDLANLLRQHTRAAQRRNEEFTNHGITETTPIDFDEIRTQLGMALVGELESLTRAIYGRIENDKQTYVNAGESLYNKMVSIFGSDGVMRFQPLGANERAIAAITHG